MPRSVAVVWFRRDLRVHDHPGLQHALERYDAVLPLFVVDPAILDGRWPSANRRWFLAGALRSLDEELRKRGSMLTVVAGDPASAVPEVARVAGATGIVASRDYAPYGRRRDAAVERVAAGDGIRWEAGRGLLVHEPEQIRTDAGLGYQVFSPFHRRWAAMPLRAVLPAPDHIPTAEPPPGTGGAADVKTLLGETKPTADPGRLLEPTEAAARRRLERWAGSEALREYDTGRDRLDLDGTSRLSQDLRWGLLSPVEVLARCEGVGKGPTRFRSEIAWRDFYAHLLFDQPRVAREAFRAELDDVARSNDAAAIDAWKAGRTGYPVVDAAMRQLLASGWMHNRARMIVASFLTKHLGIDWRVGEAHFMEHLVDGDPASNNGGWQWAASTGTDPQPYFRIFNPTLQGRRHDPNGDYVRRWLPELASLSGMDGPDVHDPPPGAYLPRIVDHAAARAEALAAYAALRPGAAPRPDDAGARRLPG
jgi:deoxyribodipyrimidine photo-lyase